MREWRLGQMEALRCPAKVQLFGNRDEVTQVPQFDIPIHIQYILMRCNKILDVIDRQRQTAGREDDEMRKDEMQMTSGGPAANPSGD